MTKDPPIDQASSPKGDQEAPVPATNPTGLDLPTDWSDAAADQYANSIRPSWAPDETPSQDPSQTSDDDTRGSEPPGQNLDDNAEARAGAEAFRADKQGRQRKAGLLLAGTCTVFVGLVALSLSPRGQIDRRADAPLGSPDLPAGREQPTPTSIAAVAANAVLTPPPTPPVDPAAASAPKPTPEPVFPLKTTPATKTVRLQVTTDPPEAILHVDGSRVDNPYDGQIPRGHAVLVRAQAPGHATAERRLIGDRKRTIALALRPRSKRQRRRRERH